MRSLVCVPFVIASLATQYELPAGGQATPMTYAIDGRQYVVIVAGDHGPLKTKRGDYVIAFALPEQRGTKH